MQFYNLVCCAREWGVALMTNGEFKLQMEKRTVAFSIMVLKLLRQVPASLEVRNIRDQVIRSATAVGANYREANRAESRSDFVHKIAIVAKEASESEYWLILLAELHPEIAETGKVREEAGELVRIFDKIRHSADNRGKSAP